MEKNRLYGDIGSLLRHPPQAMAILSGRSDAPMLKGTVRFYETRYGVLVALSVSGLPRHSEGEEGAFLGFHIHGGGSCTGNADDEFSDVGPHYDPYGRPHPLHSGDMPPLLDVGGYALSIFLTGRFRVEEIIGRTVIIHSMPDDFTTQPSGNSGEKLACGVIRAVR